MNINNITLNYQNDYYMYYNWLITDTITSKNINVYKLSTNDLICLIKDKIRIHEDINEAIFTDELLFVAIKFKNKINYKKSSLTFNDEFRILDNIKNIPKIIIHYDIIEKKNISNELRIENNAKKFFINYINDSIKNNNINKLEFLYNEIYSKKGKNIVQDLYKHFENINENDIKLYCILNTKNNHNTIRENI